MVTNLADCMATNLCTSDGRVPLMFNWARARRLLRKFNLALYITAYIELYPA